MLPVTGAPKSVDFCPHPVLICAAFLASNSTDLTLEVVGFDGEHGVMNWSGKTGTMHICGDSERTGGVVTAVVLAEAVINSSANGGPAIAESAEEGSISPPPKVAVDQSSVPKPVEGASKRESATVAAVSKPPY